jgi:hypothetical protein
MADELAAARDEVQQQESTATDLQRQLTAAQDASRQHEQAASRLRLQLASSENARQVGTNTDLSSQVYYGWVDSLVHVENTRHLSMQDAEGSSAKLAAQLLVTEEACTKHQQTVADVRSQLAAADRSRCGQDEAAAQLIDQLTAAKDARCEAITYWFSTVRLAAQRWTWLATLPLCIAWSPTSCTFWLRRDQHEQAAAELWQRLTSAEEVQGYRECEIAELKQQLTAAHGVEDQHAAEMAALATQLAVAARDLEAARDGRELLNQRALVGEEPCMLLSSHW